MSGFTPLTVTCAPPVLPAAPPSVSIPHFGIMQKAWGALSGAPDPADLLCQLQDGLAIAMAPVRRYLEMVEGIFAFKQCMMTIPDAIMSLDVDALWECFRTLIRVLSVVLSWVPPFPYIRTAMDIAGYCIDLLDEVLSFLQRLDAKITAWIQTYDEAEALGDLELIAFVNCGIAQAKSDVRMLMDIMQFMAPINNTLIESFLRLMNMEALRLAYQQYSNASQYYGEVATAIEDGASALPALAGFSPTGKTQHVIVPFPPLGPLLENMGRSRNAMVIVYNVLAPVVGLAPDKQTREIPDFINF